MNHKKYELTIAENINTRIYSCWMLRIVRVGNVTYCEIRGVWVTKSAYGKVAIAWIPAADPFMSAAESHKWDGTDLDNTSDARGSQALHTLRAEV
jgi:hypothetical protein